MSEATAPHCEHYTFAVDCVLFNRSARFLIDSGADVSVLPSSYARKAFPAKISLKAANGTYIKTHGYLTTNVVFTELRRSFECRFVVADVDSLILGADFFDKHKLLIDVHHKRLIDTTTTFKLNLLNSRREVPKLNAVCMTDKNILDVLCQNAAAFDITVPRPVPRTTFKIETTGMPPAAKAFRLAPDKVKAAKAEIEREVKLGRMVRSCSSYASPFFPVKKADGSWRFVADYTKLNRVTVKDNYIPPRIEDLLARIPHGCVFSKLDLEKAFFQIPIREEDQTKTAVITPFGLYEYTVMPMGLKNASQTLQRYVDSILADLPNTIAYCDDILLFTTAENHAEALDKLLQTLHQAGLVVNRKKSEFLLESVKFLGHDLTRHGYKPSEDKIQGLRNYSQPQSVKQVRRFLGLINFYRKFIPNASELQTPLTALTHKNVEFVWTDSCQYAFNQLINEASNATLLQYPAEEDKYTLTTDASGNAVGAALSSQRGPIGFFSKQLSECEKNYSVYDKELTAVFKAVTHFEWLLFGRSFVLKVDHKPLLFMFNKTATTEKRRRQIEYLSTFDMKIEYLPGKDNVAADALSRDKLIDSICLNQCFGNLPSATILKEQKSDCSIKPPTSSNPNEAWRDTKGRILVPSKYRSEIITAVHSIAHAGINSTLKQIKTSYVWPNMNNDVIKYVRNCLHCQSSKITRHVKPPFQRIGEHPPLMRSISILLGHCQSTTINDTW